MTLTRLQRAALYLQLEQIKHLKETDIASRDDIESYQDALRYGFELHYKEILDLLTFTETLSEQNCNFVLEVMLMYRCIESAKRAYNDARYEKLHFQGFDGTHESTQYYYVKWLIEQRKQWEESRGYDLNSRTPMLHKYREMLLIWRRCQDKHNLTTQDLDDLLAVQ